jgi:hypothetical protein
MHQDSKLDGHGIAFRHEQCYIFNLIIILKVISMLMSYAHHAYA